MSTGACGINCDVCGLNLKGLCSSCGPGSSETALGKLAVQERLLGSPCPILACAGLNRVDYCSRDCRSFPCANFDNGPYPFSPGFLAMQKRRKEESPVFYAPDGSHLEVASAYWQEVENRGPAELCRLTFFDQQPDDTLQFRFLNQEVRVDLRQHCLLRKKEASWNKSSDPLLELALVMYLKNVSAIHPLGQDIVGIKDLKEGHFFAGPHELKTEPLLARYGNDPQAFQRHCKAIDGTPTDMGATAFRLLPFPRVPLYFLLWPGDEEFKPRMSVLFDRSIEAHLAADAIWALVNRVILAFAKL